MVPRVMSVQSVPLLEAKNVTLDSMGSGSLRIGPTRISETWFVNTLTVATSTNNKIPRAFVYLGTESPGGFLGGTENGSRDTMGPDIALHTSQFITVKWTGGDAGATATTTVTGRRDVGGWT